ncbi:TPA: hypothetical protein ACXDAY_002272 [Clostridium botulinum]|uniref:hypothetical protein n=1 Tax=Clostridium botulinum TaxID=1491 RepID=UPI0007735436|nr:hypothetical protein [Clostridium botulinum]APR02568.1 hypothetical protein RSJ2_4200 [Clostridium botulinum]AUN01440.1 hypothetical protein RSJ19_00215 [Clostridium botulinum]MBN3359167.1 hypothetical protein [Clostridium botulinum]MBN3367242.1 hypothetical protein [Clostridium botulinum]MBN3371626.1 hypothetical protein [Clostridium botulinum]
MTNSLKNTIDTDKNREAVNRAKKAIKQYELELKSLDIQMTKNNIILDKYINSDEYKDNLKEIQELEDRERELDKESKK